MKFPAASLVPRGGQMYSHIFENQYTGIAREHFWSITVDFAPIKYANESWDCSMTSEWIRFGVRNWRDLNNSRLTVPPDDGLVESSFYMTEHDLASSTDLSLAYLAENRFRIRLEMTIDFHGYIGGDANPEMRVAAETEIEYTGLVVIPENLFPKPLTPQLVKNVASEFVDLSAYHEPEKEQHRFLLRPKW
jgi:hypothetical protein